MKKNITPFLYNISAKDRRKTNNHNSFLLWFTGLSGSGKSTIANIVESKLYKQGIKTYTLDGDNIRKGMNSDLTFTPEDRTENVRRIAEIANLFIDAGIVVLATFVSPYKKDRNNIKNVVNDINFIEIYINTSVEECERRDAKELYKKARLGNIKNMTGITAPYEEPDNPNVEIKTEEETSEQSADKIIEYITPKLKLNYE